MSNPSPLVLTLASLGDTLCIQKNIKQYQFNHKLQLIIYDKSFTELKYLMQREMPARSFWRTHLLGI